MSNGHPRQSLVAQAHKACRSVTAWWMEYFQCFRAVKLFLWSVLRWQAPDRTKALDQELVMLRSHKALMYQMDFFRLFWTPWVHRRPNKATLSTVLSLVVLYRMPSSFHACWNNRVLLNLRTLRLTAHHRQPSNRTLALANSTFQFFYETTGNYRVFFNREAHRWVLMWIHLNWSFSSAPFGSTA